MNSARRVKKVFLLFALLWVVIIGVSFLWGLFRENQDSFVHAEIEALTAYQKDVIYRRWCSEHGGVYVPVTEKTQANPFLSQEDERDLTTPSGTLLTLMNPAYMTRQVFEMAEEEHNVLGHLTSLNPIRPANAPDAWERKALEAFEQGATEISEMAFQNGAKYMRIMRPLYTERSCMKCHEQYGSKVGDVRGGLSVSLPMGPRLAIAHRAMVQGALLHALLLALGLAGIALGGRRIIRAEENRYEAESARRRTDERYRLLFNNTLDAVFVHGLRKNGQAGNFIEVNDLACKRLGYTREQLLKMNPTDIDDPQSAERVKERVKGLEKNRQVLFEAVHIAKDGRKIPVEINSHLFHFEGAPAILSIARDITQRKKAETALIGAKREAEQASQAKSQFLANISHELRTPLNAIMGFAQLLKRQKWGPLNNKQQRAANHITSSGQHLVEMINDLLDFSKVEAAKLELHYTRFSPAESLNRVKTLLNPHAEEKEISMYLDAPGAETRIHADEARFRQVLYNLLTNSIKFTTPGGRINIRMDILSKAEQSIRDRADARFPALRFSISDTGIGVKPEDHQRIFKPFERANSPEVLQQQGSGLGLAIASKMLELHGGNIWVESEGIPGKGSTFSFVMPVDGMV